MASHEGAPSIKWTEEIPLQKKLTGFGPLHSENRQFLPFVIFIYFFPTTPSPLGLGYDPEDDITGQDNWMTVDLPEASDRSRPIA